jgi:hypothetical protein
MARRAGVLLCSLSVEQDWACIDQRIGGQKAV